MGKIITNATCCCVTPIPCSPCKDGVISSELMFDISGVADGDVSFGCAAKWNHQFVTSFGGVYTTCGNEIRFDYNRCAIIWTLETVGDDAVISVLLSANWPGSCAGNAAGSAIIPDGDCLHMDELVIPLTVGGGSPTCCDFSAAILKVSSA